MNGSSKIINKPEYQHQSRASRTQNPKKAGECCKLIPTNQQHRSATKSNKKNCKIPTN